MSGAGFLRAPTGSTPTALLEFVRDGIWWYTTDEPIRIDQDVVNRAFIQTTDPRSTHYSTVRHQDIVPEHLFGRRLELLTLAVLGQLEAEANWHRIAREWIYGDEPVTELGRAEAEYLAGRRRAVPAAQSPLTGIGRVRRTAAGDSSRGPHDLRPLRANASRTLAANASEVLLGPELAAERRHPGGLDPAGDDPLERLQVVVDVDRDAVGGDAAADVDADRADLAGVALGGGELRVLRGDDRPLRAHRPRSGIGGAPAVQTPVRPSKTCAADAVLGERADHHPLEQPDEGVHVGLAALGHARRRRRSDRRPAGRARGR